MTKVTDAYDEGAAAQAQGFDHGANPYKPGTSKYRHWQNGWSDMEVASFGGYRDDE